MTIDDGIKIFQRLLEYPARAIVIPAILALNVFLDTSIIPSNFRFYHQGWLHAYSSWLAFPLLVGCLSLVAIRTRLGTFILYSFAFITAFFFAYAYTLYPENFRNEHWPLLVWISYRMFFAALIGVGVHIAGLLDAFIKSSRTITENNPKN